MTRHHVRKWGFRMPADVLPRTRSASEKSDEIVARVP